MKVLVVLNLLAAASAFSIQGRISNGFVAQPGMFPYQVGLLLPKDDLTLLCGGSIIGNRWVLTAASCTRSLIQNITVYLGTFNRTDHNEEHQKIISVPKENVIMHQNYVPQLNLNDIALIKLPEKIEFNDYIQPIKLPVKSGNDQSYDFEEAIVSGWGMTSKNGNNSEVLRYTKVRVMNIQLCIQWNFGWPQQTNICTYSTYKRSFCSDDYGDPLVLFDGSKQKTLIGVASWYISLGCEEGYPAVYTRVTSYLDWISEKIDM